MNTIFSRFKVILDMCATYCKAMLLIKLNHEKTSVLIFTKLNDVKKSQNHRFSFMRSFISFFWLQSIKEISQEKILVRNNKYNKKMQNTTSNTITYYNNTTRSPLRQNN